MATHMTTWRPLVPSFIEIARLNEDISHHAEQMLTDAQRRDGKTVDPKLEPLDAYCWQQDAKE